jgi:hypothetical protein
MFDNLIRQIDSLDGSKVTVIFPPDEDGYLDRACPSPHCEFLLKYSKKTGKT